MTTEQRVVTVVCGPGGLPHWMTGPDSSSESSDDDDAGLLYWLKKDSKEDDKEVTPKMSPPSSSPPSVDEENDHADLEEDGEGAGEYDKEEGDEEPSDAE